MIDPVEVAGKLAEALDREDYDAARDLLKDDCIYEIRGQTLAGADTIIDSYRSNAGSGHGRFDSVEFLSSVSPVDGRCARIHYTDIVTVGGNSHTHRCDQKITIDESGAVSLIVHVDLLGEVEALREFEQRHRSAE